MSNVFRIASRAAWRRAIDLRRLVGGGPGFAIAVTTAVALAAVAFGALALVQRNDARDSLRLAQSRQLAAQAQAQLGSDPELSVLLASAGVRLGSTPQAVHALSTALDASPLRGLLPVRSRQVSAIAVSHDGTRLVSGDVDGTVTLWNLQNGRVVDSVHLPGGAGLVLDLSFSANGGTVAIAGGKDCRARLWAIASRRLRIVPKAGPGCVYQARFVPRSGDLVTAGADGKVRLWNVRSLRVLKTIVLSTAKPARMRVVGALAVSPDGKLLAGGGADGKAYVYDLAAGRMLGALPGQSGGITGLAFSPESGRLLVASLGGGAIWEVTRGALLLRLAATPGGLARADWSPDGRTVAAGTTAAQDAVWSAQSGRLVRLLREGAAPPVAYSPLGPLLTGAVDGSIRFWDDDPDRPRRVTATGDGSPVRVGAAEHSPVAVLGTDKGTVLVTDALGRERFRLAKVPAVSAVAVAPDGSEVALATPSGLELWSLKDRKELQAITPPGAKRTAATATAFSGEDVLASGFGDGRVGLYPPNQRNPSIWRAEKEAVDTVAFSPDGDLLVSASSRTGTIHVWRPGQARSLETINGLTAAFTSDGRFLAVAKANGTIALLAVANWRAVRSLGGSPAPATRVVFADGGRLLAAATADGAVRIWDVADGALLRVRQIVEPSPQGATAAPGGIALTQNGTLLAGGIGYAATFDPCSDCLEPNRLLAEATARLASTGRRLTPAERAAFGVG
jgi:WD40 repeat protein